MRYIKFTRYFQFYQGMFGYALKHPIKGGNQYLENKAGLTCLTLACFLGRDVLFKEMLELSCKEFWRYSNICCSAYPLGALDSIKPSGETSKHFSNIKVRKLRFRRYNIMKLLN